jgi:hypothetical protein
MADPEERVVPDVGPDFGAKVLGNVFEIWFSPEIERRRAAGVISDDFVLWMAQVLFPEDGQSSIRLNDEVKGVMTLEADRPVQKGEVVTFADMDHIHAFELVDNELDCGHFTVVRRPSGWMLTFNALVGRKKAANLVRAALEFLKAAEDARSAEHSGPCIDNLFSCCELLSKAELIMHRIDAGRSKRHGPVHSAIHNWGRLGNVPAGFVATMKRMGNLRSAARYEGRSNVTDMPTEVEITAVRGFAHSLQHSTAAKVADEDERE